MSDERPPRSPRPERSLAGLRVALAGPGRVGTSLARWARACGASVEWLAGRTAERRDRKASEVGARGVPLAELASDDCDVLLLAVADPALDEVARELADRPQARIALHTAGARGASALAPLAAAGVHAGSFHPLKAFPEPSSALEEAAGTFFALDGPEPAVEMGRRLAGAFGGTSAVIAEDLRALYHLAASVAAGGVTTLVASAADLARELGLPDAVGRGYLELAAGALEQARRSSPSSSAGSDDAGRGGSADAIARAVTGPVSRGDFDSFAGQMELLAETLRPAGPAGERRVALFARLALETARLTSRGAAGEAELEEALHRRGLPIP